MSNTGTRVDPAPSFRFTVAFDDLPPCGFSDCTGLQSETEVQEYAEGGLNDHTWRLPGRSKQNNVTFKRGLVNKLIWDWYDAVRTGRFKARNVSIVIHDTSGADDLVEFQLLEAFPVKWIGPELSALGNNLAIETLEVAHQGLMRKK